MMVEETYLKGCFVITPTIFKDKRGHFFEKFNKKEFHEKTGLMVDFVQDNQSKSAKGVLRGLHYQKHPYVQAKLVGVTKGRVLDVCVDIRKDSETYGQYFSIILDDKKHQQIYIPKGFAHGFLVLEDDTILSYKCDNFYNKDFDTGVLFNDEMLGIDWGYPLEQLIVSEKDLNLPHFKNLT